MSNEKHGHLGAAEKEKLHKVMQKHEQLFDGKKGVWKGQDATLELKDGVEPSIQKPHGVPFPQRDQFKKELDHQC